jgi:putative addiction module component (TIGR02574 family)
MVMASIDISTLTVEQRLELLDEIWVSLYETPQAIPLSQAQREELDRRMDEVDRDGPDGIPWDEVLRRLRSKSE